jgi:membrane-bound lytic murein transglycosylase MltF
MFDVLFKPGRMAILALAFSASCITEPPETPPVEMVPAEADSASPAKTGSEAWETVADIDDPWLRPGQLKQWTGDLDGMMERGLVRVLTVPNPTHYFVDGARERGITAEGARALEEVLNKDLSTREAVSVVVIPVRRDQLLPMLIEGRGDVAISNLTVTDERRELVDFSVPFVSDVKEIVVTTPGAEPIPTLSDLSGREIWVRRSSSYYQSLEALNKRFASEGREPIDVRDADENLEDEGLLEMVTAGLYPATVVDSHKLDWLWSKIFDELTVTDVALREKGEIAAAFRKNSPLLEAAMNDFIQARSIGTAFGNTIINRYFKKSRWVHNVTATEERKKFNAVVDLFRKYSDQYDFDALMMVAQGYQESRLDQSARSPVGAIGVMQVMPETASSAPLFMDNIHELEPNIHAGIKYMRFILDQYFDDPEIDDVNRHLLAFAAYNAGPTRVARLRKQAPDYGLDPNQWFRNVQYVVASKVGQEPIRYVGNIYKYYLAYRRLRDMERVPTGGGSGG